MIQETPTPVLPPKSDARLGERARSLCARLRQLAYEKGPEYRLPSIDTICAEYGTSRGTVNSALNALEAQNIVYRRRGSGAFVSPLVYQRFVALVLSGYYYQTPVPFPFWDLFLRLFLHLAQERATENALPASESLLVHFMEAKPVQTTQNLLPPSTLPPPLRRAISEGKVHGIIGVGLDEYASTWIEEQQIPMIAFAGTGRWHVEIDYSLLVQEGVKYLISQRCRRIGLWSPALLFQTLRPQDIPVQDSVDQKLFETCLHAHNIPVDRSLSVDNRFRLQQALTGGSVEIPQVQGYETAKQVFSKAPSLWPDGIIIRDDMMTTGVLVALDELGVRPGRDVNIVSHANKGSLVLYGREKHLTLIEVDPEEIVRALFGQLDRLMAGNDPEVAVTLISPRLCASLRDPENAEGTRASDRSPVT